MNCPECKSSAIRKTFSDPDDSEFDEYECMECGLCLDRISLLPNRPDLDRFVVAKSVNPFLDENGRDIRRML